ncbi:MAG: hypothetical protein EB059_09875, partial [Alphaproteobacteria bacterium]|nr:hypothetical protein [Alphaproteobacteria bacterium]
MHPIKTGLKLFFDGIALCGALVMLGVIILAVRLMMGPLTITSLTPAFENVLSQPEYGVNTKIGQSALTWDKERRKAVLELRNVQFMDRLQQTIATIPEILLVLRPMGYFDEAHSPWNVVVQHPHMHMRLDPKGGLHLGAWVSDDGNALAAGKDDVTAEEFNNFVRDVLRSPHTRTVGFGLFANVSIIDAGLTIIDEGKQITWNIAMPALSLKRLKNDYAGKAALSITKNKMQTAVDFTLAYKAADKTFTATGSFDHLNPSLFAGSIAQLKPFDFISSPLTGSVNVSIDENIKVIDGGMNINLDKGEITLPDLYAAPLPFKSGQIVARYNRNDSKLRLETLRFDFEKMVLISDASIHVGSTPRDVSATFKLTDVQVEQLPAIWPEKAGKNARDWILENIHKGRLDEIVLNLGLTVPENDLMAA